MTADTAKIGGAPPRSSKKEEVITPQESAFLRVNPRFHLARENGNVAYQPIKKLNADCADERGCSRILPKVVELLDDREGGGLSPSQKPALLRVDPRFLLFARIRIVSWTLGLEVWAG